MAALEEITDRVNNMNVTDSQKRNRIQVSNTIKPLFFYVNLAKRYISSTTRWNFLPSAWEQSLPRSKYEEDLYINNHTTVWGSWWQDHQWGFKCCKQTIQNSYCTGAAGIEAADAVEDLMRANIARKEAADETPAQAEEKKLATWGTEIPEDLVLDQKLLTDALKKEDERKREEKDERKRKYNVKWNDEVIMRWNRRKCMLQVGEME